MNVVDAIHTTSLNKTPTNSFHELAMSGMLINLVVISRKDFHIIFARVPVPAENL